MKKEIYWMKPRLMRAARALAGWEQSDLAKEAGISISTIRKIEQGSVGTRPRTESRINMAFEKAGLLMIPESPDGGAGVRWKECVMKYLIGALLISGSAMAQAPICKWATVQFSPNSSPQVVQICVVPDEQAKIYGEIQHQREEQERQRQMLVPRVFQPFQPWRQ